MSPLGYMNKLKECDSLDEVTDLCIKSLNDGEPTYIQLDWVGKHVKETIKRLTKMSIEQYIDQIQMAKDVAKLNQIAIQASYDEDMSAEEHTRLKPKFIERHKQLLDLGEEIQDEC